MNDFEVRPEKKASPEREQTITQMSAQFVHDIATPLVTIKMLAGILENTLPLTLAAYHQLKNTGAEFGDISAEQLATLESSASRIKALAQQVNDAAKDYWQRVDQQFGDNDDSVDTTDLKNERAIYLENSANLENSVNQESPIDLKNSLRILIAEDDEIHQKIATRLLSGQHDVNVVANGREAVEYCRQKTYDLVLMDLHMPVMDGPQAVAEIVQLASRPPLILGLTNRPLGSEKKHLLQQGFNGFIEKPLRIDELTHLIKQITNEPE